MAIYTKTGDAGTTGLFDGQRVDKQSRRVQAYGTLDELNAHLSLCEKLVANEETKAHLHRLQGKIFRLCAEVATIDQAKLLRFSTLINGDEISELERIIDDYTHRLPPLRSFIYQGATQGAAELHIARTVCRRAERMLVTLHRQEPLRPEALAFINRLSDCLFTLARMEDTTAYLDEVVRRVMAKLETKAPTKTSGCEGESADEGGKTATWLREQAERLWRRAVRIAEEMAVPVVIAIVDAQGLPVLTYRMDGALLASSEIAPNKAYTAVALRMPTAELAAAVQPGADLYGLAGSVSHKLVTFGGGYPLYYRRKLVGGLGISGGTVEEDCRIARYAMAYMEAENGK